MGLSAGPVPSRVDATVKAGLLDLVAHAERAGWSTRTACALLEVDQDRVARWRARYVAHGRDGLADAVPGGGAVHGILEDERAAIIELHAQWGEVDRSHRKLAHRGSREQLVHVSPATVRRVLTAEGLVLPGNPPRDPAPKPTWPPWLEWAPNRIWCYDFTHFTRAKRCAVAVIDVVSKYWLATVVSAEESSTQVEVCFLEALYEQGLMATVQARDAEASKVLVAALRSGQADALEKAIAETEQIPLLLTVSDNGPQMRSHSTREFLAGVYIAQRFGRPGTPTDQPWIESLFGHAKTEHPHLEKITDPGILEAELTLVKDRYNTLRLHAGIGYVTPEDEHLGRGEQIRQARREGMAAARQNRIDYRRSHQGKQS
ncbi:Integrase catalytic region [Nostocoides australiense Ben110]|uniref:Integrase catalytic region n=2 Tax=Nostocoides australiense TaxID=99480 RepID=W6K301_9MICO|nr:Integrase catalytic region [Tetrasphaera australiensis Ben110]